MDTSASRSQPISRSPIVSSVYSQGSYTPGEQNPGHYQPPSTYRSSQYIDISPPDSPTGMANRRPSEGSEVSPIDESSQRPLDLPRHGKRLTSALPVPKKLSKSKYNAQKDSSRPTRWDDYSGEPTNGDDGKAPQVRPGTQTVRKSSVDQQQQNKYHFNLLTKGRELNESRKNFVRNRDAKKEPQHPHSPPREPWRGASGRTATVPPIESKRGVSLSPLQTSLLPTDTPQASQAPPSHSDRVASTGSAAVATSNLAGRKEAQEESQVKPNVPPKNENHNQATSKDRHSEGPSTPRATPRRSGPGEREKPLPPTSRDTSASPEVASKFHDLALDEQPRSRFSTTTYGTTDTGSLPGTPRLSNTDKETPPLPSIKVDKRGQSAQLHWGPAKRKPTPSERTMSMSKTLPQCPPEMQARDRVEAMEAKIDDLRRRRGNIDTLVYELTQVVQPSSTAYDLATRGEVKRTVESLQNELADIRKEEHDVGMTLLRALKKRDERDYYSQPSGLWIRRVTS